MGESLGVCAALSMLPLALAAIAVLTAQNKARVRTPPSFSSPSSLLLTLAMSSLAQALLLRTRRHVEVEDVLVAALAPPALSRRFLSGEQVVADDVQVPFAPRHALLAASCASHGTQTHA
eukprot:1745444-Rhodomonas_salina.1